MIDWIAFIDSLDEKNFASLSKAVSMRNRDLAEEKAESIVLSFTEVEMARADPIAAVKLIHARLKCGLLVAKLAVDLLLLNDEENEEENVYDGPLDDDDNELNVSTNYEQMTVD